MLGRLSTKQKVLIGGGLALLVVGWLARGQVIKAAGMVFDKLKQTAFKLALSTYGQRYASIILRVAQEQQVSPFILGAIGEHESGWGRQLAANGTGDGGHGRGLMQIDDRSHGAWLASHDWRDPYQNIAKGAAIYRAGYVYLQQHGVTGDLLERAALAAYNAGPGRVLSAIQAGQSPESITTGGSYTTSIFQKLGSLIDRFSDLVGANQSSPAVAGWPAHAIGADKSSYLVTG